jgi:RNA polymerase II subunit A-like phosphatase
MSDDQDLTPLSLPTTLPYPITLTRLHAAPDQSISRGSPLLSYTFTSSTNIRELARLQRGQALSEGIRREDVREGDMSATWESGIEGDFVRWEDGIEVGRVVERKHASYVSVTCGIGKSRGGELI